MQVLKLFASAGSCLFFFDVLSFSAVCRFLDFDLVDMTAQTCWRAHVLTRIVANIQGPDIRCNAASPGIL